MGKCVKMLLDWKCPLKQLNNSRLTHQKAFSPQACGMHDALIFIDDKLYLPVQSQYAVSRNSTPAVVGQT